MTVSVYFDKKKYCINMTQKKSVGLQVIKYGFYFFEVYLALMLLLYQKNKIRILIS